MGLDAVVILYGRIVTTSELLSLNVYSLEIMKFLFLINKYDRNKSICGYAYFRYEYVMIASNFYIKETE